MNESAWLVWAAMGGHALYVWGSLGACALLMAAECWLLRLRRAMRQGFRRVCKTC